MSVIEVEKLIQEVSPEVPSGENLEYDPKYIKMVEVSQGKPERQMGDTVIEAE